MHIEDNWISLEVKVCRYRPRRKPEETKTYCYTRISRGNWLKVLKEEAKKGTEGRFYNVKIMTFLLGDRRNRKDLVQYIFEKKGTEYNSGYETYTET